MDIASFNLRDSCHVNTNEDGDRFVGVKADQNNAVVYFPLGYQLPEDDRQLRRDIRTLFSILSAFGSKEDKVLRGSKFMQSHPIDFPIQAFLDVIDYYFDNNGHYYVETEKKYKTSNSGNIDWPKTLKRKRSLFKGDSLIFTDFVVPYQTPLENELITTIHKFCVYYSFQRLGWLYTNLQIENLNIYFNKKVFIQEIRKKLATTNKDRNKRLFKSMLAMIEFIDDRVLDKQFYFGTDNFEYIWEKLIDKVFGIPNKAEYLPKGMWTERHGKNKEKETHALIPDTIMIYKDRIYILDAKYYKYGTTHNLKDLPDSSSINKQITYGDYIAENKKIGNDSLFNAFLMPYNSGSNYFETNERIVNVAEAYGDWRANGKNYEKIQGILIDIRHMIYNYLGNHEIEQELLAQEIEKYLMD
ncbi:MAG: LlaJI family restriction endonuclease [Anaeroplasma bactoclasticum]|nr:LlaJI family restriction endonuclease [Anaeroplasma bactoclasticum]